VQPQAADRPQALPHVLGHHQDPHSFASTRDATR
jgi:hypothetical protein